MTVLTILFAIVLANLIYDLPKIIKYCFDQSKRKKIDKHEDSVTSGYISEYMRHDGGGGVVGTINNQIVYKVDGDFNGNIKGDNVTVILMGDGNINGNIESQDGNVVLIKGNINGNVKADKIVCPCPDDAQKQKHGINIKSYSVILPMYVRHSGYINVPIHLEFTDNGELIGIKQIQK